MSAVAVELEELRARLEARFGGAIVPAGAPPVRDEEPGFFSGVESVDRLLPRGVSRNALTLWMGAAGSGRTATLRALVEGACRSGARVGLVDAARTLDAGFGCTGDRALEGLWVVRPPEGGREREGGWAAEALLRAGVFGLVVLDGYVPDGPEAYRLRGLAREHGAALLISVETEGVRSLGGLGWRADARLEFRRTMHRERDMEGLTEGGRFRRRSTLSATGMEREVELVHEPADRLRPGAPGRDRRPRPE